jgi:cell wall-associated NlpC family hydrolase
MGAILCDGFAWYRMTTSRLAPILVLLLLWHLSGCSAVPPEAPIASMSPPAAENVQDSTDPAGRSELPEEPAGLSAMGSTGERVLEIARQFVGVPYRKGGASPTGFDCSGLVFFSYLQAGFTVPRTSASQHQAAHAVPFDALRPGDLLFFQVKSKRVSHVGIFVEENLFLHAASPGKGVIFSRLDEPFWKKRLVGAGRFGDQIVD